MRGRNVWITSMSALCVVHPTSKHCWHSLSERRGTAASKVSGTTCKARVASCGFVEVVRVALQRISQDQERCPCSRLLQLSLWLMAVLFIYNVISSTRAILVSLREITSEMSSQSVRRSSTVRFPSLPIFALNKNYAQCLQNVSMISRYRTWSVSMVRTPWNATSRLSSKMWLLSRVRVSSERRQKSVAHVT